MARSSFENHVHFLMSTSEKHSPVCVCVCVCVCRGAGLNLYLDTLLIHHGIGALRPPRGGDNREDH